MNVRRSSVSEAQRLGELVLAVDARAETHGVVRTESHRHSGIDEVADGMLFQRRHGAEDDVRREAALDGDLGVYDLLQQLVTGGRVHAVADPGDAGHPQCRREVGGRELRRMGGDAEARLGRALRPPVGDRPVGLRVEGFRNEIDPRKSLIPCAQAGLERLGLVGRRTHQPDRLGVEVGVLLADATLRFSEQGHVVRPQPGPDADPDFEQHGAVARGVHHGGGRVLDEVHVAHRDGTERGAVEVAVQSCEARHPRRQLGKARDGVLPVVGRPVVAGGEQPVELGHRLGVPMDVDFRELSSGHRDCARLRA